MTKHKMITTVDRRHVSFRLWDVICCMTGYSFRKLQDECRLINVESQVRVVECAISRASPSIIVKMQYFLFPHVFCRNPEILTDSAGIDWNSRNSVGIDRDLPFIRHNLKCTYLS